jgi:PKD repeat protein
VIFTSANGGNSTNAVSGSGAIVPVAAFTATPTNGTTPLIVTFNDSSTGTITNRTWDFGDNVTSNTTVTSLTHTYATGGTYTVRLVVNGPLGASTNSQVNLILALDPPHLVTSPGSRDFGAVTIGQTNGLSFQVVNTGDLPLIGNAAVGGPFAIGSGSPFNVPGGQTQTVVVSFLPVASGTFSNAVLFSSNGGASTNDVRGVGVTPGQLGVSPVARDFGTIATGTISQAVFTVTNSGGTTISNGTATVTGGPFTIVSGSTFNLTGGTSTNVVVRFAPVSEASFSDTVIFTSANGGNSTNPVTGSGAVVPLASFSASPTNGAWPLTVTFTDTSTGTITNRFWNFGDSTTVNTLTNSLTHTYNTPGSNTVTLIINGPVGVSTNTKANLILVVNPPQLVVAPASRDLGSTTIGLTNSQSFSVINLGDLPLIGTATVGAPFAVGPGASFNVGGGKTQSVTVSFLPVAAGASSNAVVFNSNGGVSTNAVTGTGLTPGQLGVSPVALDFGPVPTGTSTQGVFLVTNSGGTTVSNGTAAVTGGPFTILSGNSFSLPGGASTNVIISFTPVTVNTFTNAVIINSANGGRFTNRVSGSGAIIPVAAFSGTPTTGPAPLDVTFTDTSTGTITNRTWSFGDGMMTNTLTTSVTHHYNTPGSNTVNLTVRGPVGASSQIRTNYIIVVKPPQLVVSPTVLNFGDVVVAQSTTMPVAVSNPGDLPLTGTATIGMPFSVVSGSPFNVPAGQTQVVTVSFSPLAQTTYSNAVLFSSNGGASTNTATGRGVPPLRLLVAPLSLKVAESGTASFTVVLSESPGSSLTVDITKEPGGDASLSASGSLTFTAGNWDQPQAVVVSSATDDDNVNGTASFRASSSGLPDVIVDVQQVDKGQFVPVSGTYAGLIESTPPTHENSGFGTFKVAGTGAVKAKLIFGGKKYSLKTQFDEDGNAGGAINRAGLVPLMVTLHVAVDDGTDQMTGTVSDGTVTSVLLANRNVFDGKTSLWPDPGIFTVVFPADSTNSGGAFPQGDGYATLKVDTKGFAKLSGVFGDGSKVKLKTAISKYGTLPFYISLYKGNGSAIGWATFTNIVNVSDLSAMVNWFKLPSPADAFYPDGFTLETPLIGAKYIAPPSGAPASGFANGLVTLGDGNLQSNLVKHVTIEASGSATVVDPGPDNLTLKIAGSSGKFQGKFVHPASGRSSKFSGLIIQKQQMGGGNFAGTNQTGFVTLQPDP